MVNSANPELDGAGNIQLSPEVAFAMPSLSRELTYTSITVKTPVRDKVNNLKEEIERTHKIRLTTTELIEQVIDWARINMQRKHVKADE